MDEAHRSIFKKYKAIFDYFDAPIVGLTATPKTEVDRNTYDFFETPPDNPTFAYDYETAVDTDHVLVPYRNPEVTTQFLEQGIVYDNLSEEDKERYEEDFADEDGNIPDAILPAELNRFIFNRETVDLVLDDLMRRGIKIQGGDVLGKTIIFAQNKQHAQFIVERFDALYPHLKGRFAKRVVCGDDYAQTIIDEFKCADNSLTQQQIVFVERIIGYIKPAVLNLPPFDRPQKLVNLFDAKKQEKLYKVIETVTENAVKVIE